MRYRYTVRRYSVYKWEGFCVQRVGLGFEEISETGKPNVKFGSFNIWEADNPIYQPLSILSYDLICVHVW